jgi:hypothetical protein
MSSVNAHDKVTPQQPHSTRTFRKAFAFGALWWIAFSLVGIGYNHTHPPGYIFGEFLVPSLVGALIAGAVGRIVRVRAVWPLVIAVFLIAWFIVRLAMVVAGGSVRN